MPCLKIFTNLPRSKIPGDFLDKLIPTLSKVVDKPPERFFCVVQTDCQVAAQGDSQTPAVVASLESIGNVGLLQNVAITSEITKLIQKELSVEPSRIFLTFYDLAHFNVGIGGTTVQDAINKSVSPK